MDVDTVTGHDRLLIADAVLFDLDGTLVDSGAAIERSWRTWAAEYGLTEEDFARYPMHGRTAAEIVADLVDVELVSPALDRIVELEATDADGVVALPGALDLLTALPADRWAVVTSGDRRVASHRLSLTAIEPRALVSADDVDRGKPDPEPFLTGARRLGVDPARCVGIEDSHSGLQAARAAGMGTVAVTTTHARNEIGPGLADLVVDTLGELRINRMDGGALQLRASTPADHEHGPSGHPATRSSSPT